MSVTMAELKNRADNCFGEDGKFLGLAKVPGEIKDRVKVYEALNLSFQARNAKNIETTQSMGFPEISLDEMYKLLTGSNPSKKKVLRRINHEFCGPSSAFAHNNFSPIQLSKGWLFKRKKMLLGGIPNLRLTIPYGVALKLEELTKLQIFNSFMVMAPLHCFEANPKPIDPVVVGAMFELRYTYSTRLNNQVTTIENAKYFFVAQW